MDSIDEVEYRYRSIQHNKSPFLFCECQIKLVSDNEIFPSFSPHETIYGQVLVRVKCKNYGLQNVRIQLEGYAISDFKTKQREQQSDEAGNFKSQMFLPQTKSSRLKSPLNSVHLVDYTADRRSYPDCEESYPFKIQLKGQQLPPTYCTESGRIAYKLVVHVVQYNDDLIACEKDICVSKGHYTLTSDPSLSVPLLYLSLVTKAKAKATATIITKSNLKLNLFLKQRGYLSEEDLSLKIILENPKCDLIGKIRVGLVQKIVYSGANGVSKVTGVVLGENTNFCYCSDCEMCWETGFHLPANLMPSFCIKEIDAVQIVYSIEVLVTTSSPGSFELKGEAEIVVGTSREDPVQQIESECGEWSESGSTVTLVSSTSTSDLRLAPQDEHKDADGDESRRCFSTESESSTASTSTLPPDYSSLSSRSPSLDTFLPTYKSAVDKREHTAGDLNPGFRSRCASNSNVT